MSDAVTAAVAELESISLAELNANAELQTRRDRKYVVPALLLPSILAEGGFQALEIDGRRTFHYESVYFDTETRASYRQAAQKRRLRFKVRTRSYLDSNTCWLEVKTRTGRGLNEKTRMKYDIRHRSELTSDGLDFVKGFVQIAPVYNDLQKAITTRYRRTTLLDSESASRITIDTHVEWEAPNGTTKHLENVAIVETKTTGAPSRVDRSLWAIHCRPAKISKFGTGLAAVTPGLPANKWNRVLRRYFNWEPERSAQPAPARPVTQSAFRCVAGFATRLPRPARLEKSFS